MVYWLRKGTQNQVVVGSNPCRNQIPNRMKANLVIALKKKGRHSNEAQQKTKIFQTFVHFESADFVFVDTSAFRKLARSRLVEFLQKIFGRTTSNPGRIAFSLKWSIAEEFKFYNVWKLNRTHLVIYIWKYFYLKKW